MTATHLRKRKILICAVWAGGGHIAAMEGLSLTLRSLDYPHPVETFTSSEKELGRFHEWMYTKMPWAYALGYYFTHSPVGRPIEKWSTRKTMQHFMRELAPHFEADSEVAVIVSTHFLMTRALLALKARYPQSGVRVVGFVPDFDRSTIHIDGFRGHTLDGAIARNPELLARLRKRYGLQEKFLAPGGYAPSAAFSQVRALSPDQALREIFQTSIQTPGRHPLSMIEAGRMTIVVAGGSGWCGRIASKVEALLASSQLGHSQYQILVVTGGSPDAIKRYTKLQERYPTAQIVLLPRLSHAHLALIYRAADLVWLAGLAPATLFELIETDVRPILLSYVHPGQEQENLQFALKRKLLTYAPNKSDAIAEIVKVHRNLDTARAARLKDEPRYFEFREELSANNQRIAQLLSHLI